MVAGEAGGWKSARSALTTAYADSSGRPTGSGGVVGGGSCVCMRHGGD